MNLFKNSGGKLWFRATAVLLGIGLLAWLTIEDSNTLSVIIFAGAISAWLGARMLIDPPENRRLLFVKHVFIGFGAGFILAPIAVLLMALKTGIHGHGTPDFTVAQIESVLSRTPFFALSGFLIGLGSGLWRLARSEPYQEGG